MTPADLIEPFQLEEHQYRALCRAMDDGAPNVFVLYHKQGLGKSRTSLAMFECSGFKDVIIVCRRVAFETWIDEINLLNLDYTIYRNGYKVEGLVQFSRNKKAKRVLLISAGDLKNLPQKLPWGEMLIVDELYLFANYASQRSQLIQKLSLFCSARVGLSGTIMPAQDNSTIFGQLMALQAHRYLARGITEFRKLFQNKCRGQRGFEFNNRNGAYEEIKAKIGFMVDVYFPESRPTRTQIIKINKTLEQIAAVKELQELYEHREKTYDWALQIVHAVNGISNGWWKNDQDTVESRKSEKLDYLLSLVDDLIAAEERVVIWCAYHNDISRIGEELNKKKIEWVEFSATCAWNAQGWDRVVLATEANGSSVNYFKHVKYAIYYSIDTKLLNLQQSMTRHERKGSEHDGAHYYFLQTKGTLDAHTYDLVTKSDKSEKELIMTLANKIMI